jgi:hypothetical protein
MRRDAVEIADLVCVLWQGVLTGLVVLVLTKLSLVLVAWPAVVRFGLEVPVYAAWRRHRLRQKVGATMPPAHELFRRTGILESKTTGSVAPGHTKTWSCFAARFSDFLPILPQGGMEVCQAHQAVMSSYAFKFHKKAKLNRYSAWE